MFENYLPFVTLTKPGLIKIIDNTGKQHIIDFGSFGFLEGRPENERITLLAG